MIIEVDVSNKIARVRDRTIVGVCGNSDYVIHFNFDDEWSAYENKTARFKWGGTFTDVVFTGNECPMPIIYDTNTLEIGVYAGELHTTTAAVLYMKKSVLCGSGTPVDPKPDVYGQIMELMELLNKRVPAEVWEDIHRGAVGDTGVYEYFISKDNDGNAFALKKFDFEITTTTAAFYQGDGLCLNDLWKRAFTTGSNKYNGDSYLSGVQGAPMDIDTTQPGFIRLRWIGEIQNGGVLQMLSFGYQIYTDTSGTVRVNDYGAGGWSQRRWNMITSKGALFPNGLTSCGYLVFYRGLRNAKITLRGVRM